MINFESEEILYNAKLGRWNLKVTLIMILVMLNGPLYYIYANIMYGSVDFVCDDDFYKAQTVLNTDKCLYSYTYDNSTFFRKCSHFKMLPGKDFGTTLRTDYQLVCDKEHFFDADVTVMLTGIFFSTILGNLLVDLIGRKHSLILCMACCSICSLLYLIPSSIFVILVIRLFDTFFMQTSYYASMVFISESVPYKYRIFGTTILETFFGFGLSLASIFSFFLRKWQLYIIFRQAIPFVVTFVIALGYLDESPKWLLQTGKYAELVQLSNKIFRLNRESIPQHIQQRLRNLEFENAFKVKLSPDPRRRILPFWQLCKTKRTAFRMLALALNWTANLILLYGLMLGADIFGLQVHVFFIFKGLLYAPACIVQLILANKYGRKSTNLTCQCICMVCFILTIFLPAEGTLKYAYYVNVMVINLFHSSMFINNVIWNCELMPTNMRTFGVGFCTIVARILVSPIAPIIRICSTYWAHLPAVFFALLLAVSALASLGLPETLNQLMPDNITEFECFGTEKYHEIKMRRMSSVKASSTTLEETKFVN